MKAEPPTTMLKTQHGSLKGAGLNETLNSNIEVMQWLTAVKASNSQWTVDDFPQL